MSERQLDRPRARDVGHPTLRRRRSATPVPPSHREDESRHESPKPLSGRLPSLDVTRGWAIVILLLAVNPFPREHLPAQLKHVQWHGLSFADLFFPLFLFVMGVSMSLSQSARSPRLVLRRVALLMGFGVALASMKHGQLYVTGVLQHIAGAYLLAWLVLRAPRRAQPVIAAGILLVIWAAFLLWAGGERDPWGQQGTVAHAVDGWLIGRFATEGILQTVTSTVTVVGGALIGWGLRERRDARRIFRWIGGHAVWLIGLGLLMALVIPINKRLWTPSFTVLTLGTSCAWFALFVWFVEIRRRERWVRPLQELGVNPIAIYVVFMAANALIAGFRDGMPRFAPFASEAAGAMTYAFVWLVLGLVFAHVLFRRRIFFKI